MTMIFTEWYNNPLPLFQYGKATVQVFTPNKIDNTGIRAEEQPSAQGFTYFRSMNIRLIEEDYVLVDVEQSYNSRGGKIRVHYNANAAPYAPSSITLPSQLIAKINSAIRWGTATDPDNNLVGYELSVAYGESDYKTVLYKGSAQNYTHVIPAGVTQAQYFVRAYDAYNAFSPYTTSQVNAVINNQGPIISGMDANLGVKNSEFSYTYQVTDPDNDAVSVVESLDGVAIKTLANAPKGSDIVMTVSQARLNELTPNETHTLEIKASDTSNHVTYRRLTFVRTNMPPIITAVSDDLGIISGSLNTTVSVSDPDGDSMTVKWLVNGVQAGTQQLATDGDVSITMPHNEFVKLKPGVRHSIRVEAVDEKGAVGVKMLSFTRSVDELLVRGVFRSSMLDAAVTTMYISMLWKVAEGAQANVKVCNNYDDDNPTWEDITPAVLGKINAILTNTSKTAPNWAIGVEVNIKKGSSTDMSWFSSMGGSIK